MQNLGNQSKKGKNAVYLIIQIRYMCCVSQKKEKEKKDFVAETTGQEQKSSPTRHRYRHR